jgi:hypothetical protein
MSENDIPDTAPVKVWVTEHDDPEVRWVINSRDDMEQNLADAFAEVNEGGTVKIVLPDGDGTEVHFDAADLFKAADPIGYEETFLAYAQGWTLLEMPFEVFFSSVENADRDWVTEHINDN